MFTGAAYTTRELLVMFVKVVINIRLIQPVKRAVDWLDDNTRAPF